MDIEGDDGLDALDGQAEVETQTNPEPSAAAPAPSAQPAAPVQQQQQPQQPQAPDPRLQWYDEFYQRYQSDPILAQKFEQLYNPPQQQQQHPYDWMADEKRQETMRQVGMLPPEQRENHPEWIKQTQEFTNFFNNQVGHIANLVNHPKVVEAMYGAMAPQVQDMVSRIVEQRVGPLNQWVQQQGDQQFRQQYGQAYNALPPHIKAAHEKGFFGQGPQGIIHAIEFAKLSPQQQAEAGVGAEQPEQQPAAVNKNTAKTPGSTSTKEKAERDEEEALEKAARAWSESKKKK